MNGIGGRRRDTSREVETLLRQGLGGKCRVDLLLAFTPGQSELLPRRYCSEDKGT